MSDSMTGLNLMQDEISDSDDLYSESGFPLFTGIQALAHYLVTFRRNFMKHSKTAEKALKSGKKKEFDTAIKAALKACDEATVKVNSISECTVGNLLNTGILMQLFMKFIPNKRSQYVSLAHTKNWTKANVLSWIQLCREGAENMSNQYDNITKGLEVKSVNESAFREAIETYLESYGEIDSENYLALKALYESDDNDDDEGEEAESDDNDSDSAEKKNMSKKVKELMDIFNDMSDKDKEAVQDLIGESADDSVDDETFIMCMESAIESITGKPINSIHSESTGELDFSGFDFLNT